MLYLKDFAGGTERRVSGRPGLNIGPSWLADGSRFALTLSPNGDPDIFLMDLDGKILRQLVSGWGIDVSPSFAPDGRRLAFVSNRSGSPQIYVLDLDSGAVVHVGRGKGGDALTDFWKRLRGSGAKIAAVATDMSPAYIDAVATHLPHAVLVFDRFHVVKLLNDKLSDLRREMYREIKDKMQKDVLKGARWLLLKRPENLDDAKDERKRLDEALRLNAPLATAYYLKEELRELWEQDDQEEAEKFLLDWILRAESTGIRVLHGFARTLRIHAFGILAYYDYAISTGPLEGTNNKIKTMKRQAYGFRDQEFLRLKILGIHQSKYALVG